MGGCPDGQRKRSYPSKVHLILCKKKEKVPRHSEKGGKIWQRRDIPRVCPHLQQLFENTNVISDIHEVCPYD